jgi:hypothetical protein
MLREAGKADPLRLKRYLLAHGPLIPRTTLRYARWRDDVSHIARPELVEGRAVRSSFRQAQDERVHETG